MDTFVVPHQQREEEMDSVDENSSSEQETYNFSIRTLFDTHGEEGMKNVSANTLNLYYSIILQTITVQSIIHSHHFIQQTSLFTHIFHLT